MILTVCFILQSLMTLTIQERIFQKLGIRNVCYVNKGNSSEATVEYLIRDYSIF